MKTLMTALAVYNQGANRALCETISKVDEDLLKKDCGTYYHSVLATVHHYLGYEIFWLKTFKATGPKAALDKAILDDGVDDVLAKGRDSFAETRTILATIDSIYVELMDEMTGGGFEETVKFTNPRGEQVERKYWNILFHVLNHSTHHRGEISAMLDTMKISNDYAGFFRYA
jgi:uncharacterized damage-inducible protein DinB